jgi:hypothetical protein
MDWRCGSSGRAPALQVQSPDLKPQSHSTTPQKSCLEFMNYSWNFPSSSFEPKLVRVTESMASETGDIEEQWIDMRLIFGEEQKKIMKVS